MGTCRPTQRLQRFSLSRPLLIRVPFSTERDATGTGSGLNEAHTDPALSPPYEPAASVPIRAAIRASARPRRRPGSLGRGACLRSPAWKVLLRPQPRPPGITDSVLGQPVCQEVSH